MMAAEKEALKSSDTFVKILKNNIIQNASNLYSNSSNNIRGI